MRRATREPLFRSLDKKQGDKSRSVFCHRRCWRRHYIGHTNSVLMALSKCSVHGHECHEGLFARNLYLGQRIPLAGVAHQNGTIRFGDDPKTSALDRNCKAHEARQSLRRGRRLFLLQPRGKSGTHHHCQCAARRRSFAGANGRGALRRENDGRDQLTDERN
jgi:hypothetical protein